jgi:hypothetical protein
MIETLIEKVLIIQKQGGNFGHTHTHTQKGAFYSLRFIECFPKRHTRVLGPTSRILSPVSTPVSPGS